VTIRERKLHLASVPAWLISRGEPAAAGARGTVLFWHGFSVSKEIQAKELTSLAERGYLAVGLDNVGHGERRRPDFDAHFAGSGPRFDGPFLEAVRQTAVETPAVIDALVAHGLAREDRVGLAGISMGAFITYRAALCDRRVRAAACILGSPRWKMAAPDSPHLHPEAFYPLAILSQCAGEDRNVRPHDARDFHAVLASRYGAAPERQRFIEFPGVGHFMPQADWDVLWGNVLDWFDRFLAPPS
jgi:hypothetical protein